MNKLYFTPGPSQLYPTVEGHIKHALKDRILSISHRGTQFQEIFQTATENLKKLMNIPEAHQIFFLSSSTEAMEIVISNCVQNSSLHFINGAFSKRFFETALALGKQSHTLEIEWGTGFTEKLLKNQKLTANSYQLHAFTHNETSTGVATDLNLAYELKKQNPRTLLAVDIVSSAPLVGLDWSYVDAAFFSVQKCLGLPAGLGVLILSPRAVSPPFQGGVGGGLHTYHSLPTLHKYAAKHQTPETPNVLGIYLLSRVAQDFLDKKLQTIRAETKTKADILYNFFDQHPDFQVAVTNPAWRSQTMIVINTKSDNQQLIKHLSEQGIIIGTGYGEHKQTQIRIANYPAHTIEQIQKLIVCLKS